MINERYQAAQEQYQRAQQIGDSLAFGGVVRTTMRLGDITKAMGLLQGMSPLLSYLLCVVFILTERIDYETPAFKYKFR